MFDLEFWRAFLFISIFLLYIFLIAFLVHAPYFISNSFISGLCVMIALLLVIGMLAFLLSR